MTATRGRARRPIRRAGPPAESAVSRARRALEIARRLSRRYPDARIPLHHRTPLELLVATILSAQCTDAMVNRVTPALFARYPTAAAYAAARPEDLEGMIRSTGFYHAKARAIQRCCRLLVERHGGEVPRTLEDLVRLDGVGRKTANVVLSLFGVPGVVVDTHVRRLSRRMALTGHDDPDKIEQDLMVLVPREAWSDFSLRLIYFGREVCTAVRPRCPACPLRDVCPSARYLGAPPWMAPAADGRRAYGVSQDARAGKRARAAAAAR